MRTVFAILLILISCSDPTSESERPRLTTFTGSSMTMPYRLLVGRWLSEEEEAVVELALLRTFEKVDRIFNKYNPNSELSTLNRLPAGEKIELSPELERFLIETDEMVRLTGGRFDPTIEPLQALWRLHLEQGELPPPDEIREVAITVGWDTIHLHDGLFWKEHSATQLDLGGIAKGLCVDLMIKALRKLGFHDLYFEWGGEIATSGRHPEGRPWRVYISALGENDPREALAELEVENEALATSGDYLQFWETSDGAVYTHIIDPRTKSPIQTSDRTVASASILAPSCQVADALATAAMLFPSVEESRRWTSSLKAKIPQLEAWITSRQELSDGQ